MGLYGCVSKQRSQPGMWPSKVCCARLFRGFVSSKSNIPALLTVRKARKYRPIAYQLAGISYILKKKETESLLCAINQL